MLKLKRLFANMDSFHAINFKDGLNVIVGKQTKHSLQNKKSTTNGIGKSLIVKIVDFCLGSEQIKEWKIPLKDWIFSLDVQIGNDTYTFSRAINEQNKILVNEQELTLPNFREKLKDLLEISPDFSFRQLINRFLRKGKTSYNNYLTSIPKEKDCVTLLIISYLLGIDYKLCQQKINLKKELDSNKDILSKSQNDASFRELFGIGTHDLELELSNIEFEIDSLEKEIQSKNYAENYTSIQLKANQTSDILNNLNNRKFVIEENISAINEALTRQINVDLSDVKEVYEEIGIFFGEKLNHSLEQVEQFHKELLLKRKETLSKDLLNLQLELKQILKQIEENNRILNELLEFLKIHSAMDKYVVAIRQLDALKNKKQELLRISNIEKDIEAKIRKIKAEFSESNIVAQTYLDSINSKREETNKQFVYLTKSFYGNKKSALSIKVNDGENQIRFNIDARITSDGSDGIQEIVTFCFDWILLNQNITKQGFIYHDSLLLANVEKRQKEILFQIINELCKKNNKQYIINVNEDQIESFESKTRKIIDDNTVLTLTDESVASKLLGIEVDLGREINTID